MPPQDKRSDTELYLEYLLMKVDEGAALIDQGLVQAGRDVFTELQTELVRLCGEGKHRD